MQSLEKWLFRISILAAVLFAARAVYIYYYFAVKYPAAYANQSAPWYVNVLIEGAFTAGIILICVGILHIVRKIKGGKRS